MRYLVYLGYGKDWWQSENAHFWHHTLLHSFSDELPYYLNSQHQPPVSKGWSVPSPRLYGLPSRPSAQEKVKNAGLRHHIDCPRRQEASRVGCARLRRLAHQRRPEHCRQVVQGHLVDALQLVHPVGKN